MKTETHLRTYWHNSKNVGDTLSEPLVEYLLNVKCERAEREDEGKLLAVGSVLSVVKQGDTIWGSGSIDGRRIILPEDAEVIALRGEMTKEVLIGSDNFHVVYGDPALLLPFVYCPKIEKKRKVGLVPHYVDWDFAKPEEGEHFISVALPFKQFIDEMTSCEKIISSSLHGIILAEAYGIPAVWRVYGERIKGGKFKFRDYFSGTFREVLEPSEKVLPEIDGLRQIRENLGKVLIDWFARQVDKKVL